ncbi:hypothetical protein OAC45_01605 [Gammaproteobacteria bacterium]|nr:hypothetical protein [Gammaproteobacteria bacterium]
MKIRITEKNGVYFTESELDVAEDVKHINHKLDGILGNAMLKNLSDLKAEMANFALSINCNLIHSFKYRQKQTISFRAIFGTDDTFWEGAGICAKISPGKIEEIIEEQKES